MAAARFGAKLDCVRLLVLLLLPAALLLGTAYLEQAVVGQSAPSAHGRPQAIVWGGRTFTQRRQLAHWLRAHGASYEAWARRHPTLAAPAPGARTRAAAGSSVRDPSGTSAGEGHTDWARPLTAGVVVLGGGATLIWALRRRRSLRLRRAEERSSTSRRRLTPLLRNVFGGASRGTHTIGGAGETIRSASHHAVIAMAAARDRHGDVGWYVAACVLAVAIGFLLPHAL